MMKRLAENPLQPLWKLQKLLRNDGDDDVSMPQAKTAVVPVHGHNAQSLAKVQNANADFTDLTCFLLVFCHTGG